MRAVATLALITLAGPALAHDPMMWNGSEIHVILESEATGGEMGMFTTRFSEPGGPPRHVHSDAAEGFVVLEGRAQVLSGTETMILEEGEAAFVPAGEEHTFRVLGEDGGQLLVVVTPGGFEGFFEATLGVELPGEMERFNEISESFGQSFTGPPLAAE